MPTYTFVCTKCNNKIELFMTYSQYKEEQVCEKCSSLCVRSYSDDLLNTSGFVRLSDDEIKTIGHLAHRNTEKMSQDQKESLRQKHNAYKYEDNSRPLPQGMSRIKRGPKTIWPK